MQRRGNTEILPALNEPQLGRQRGNKCRKLLVFAAGELIQRELHFRALRFCGNGYLSGALNGDVFIVLAAEIHHQFFRVNVQNLTDELPPGPGDA